MSVLPDAIDADRQPPMAVPLGHFLVGLGFLLGGVVVGAGLLAGVVPGFGTVAHVHLLLVGWVGLTIMGAMTQFVPVWSGVDLYSRRLASIQLLCVVAGLGGFVASLTTGSVWLPAFGTVLVVGFWTFAYNIARTLAAVEDYDVTERHFLLAVGFFVVLSPLGAVLAADLTWPILPAGPVSHATVLGTHVTVAVFGALLTTVYGALYQLGPMFTGTDLDSLDTSLQTVEESAHVLGVLALAAGRLADWTLLAQVGGTLVCLAAVAVGIVLGRRLVGTTVEWSPMHTRYAVAASALTAWAVVSLPAWLATPTSRRHLLGAAGTGHLLALGAIGFVIVGTLYHIVPFIVWLHRYSDLVGLEDVPMVEDLYDDRLATIEAVLLVGGTALLVAADGLGVATLVGAGGLAVSLGAGVFVANMALVVYTHSPRSVWRLLVDALDVRTRPAVEESTDQYTDRRKP
jgi:hypothetical protein